MCGDGRGRGRGRDFPLNRLLQQNLPPPSSRPWGLLAWLGLEGAGAGGGVVSVSPVPRGLQDAALCAGGGGQAGSPQAAPGTPPGASPRSPDIQTSMSRSPGHQAAYIQGRAESQPRPALRGVGSDSAHSCPSVGTGESCPPRPGTTWDRASEGHLDVSTKPTAGSVGAGYRREVTSGRHTGGPDTDATAIRERVGEAPPRARPAGPQAPSTGPS